MFVLNLTVHVVYLFHFSHSSPKAKQDYVILGSILLEYDPGEVSI